MKIIYVSSYLPRQCGIATFTHDIIQSVRQSDSETIQDVIALTDADTYDYPKEVVSEIRQHEHQDYLDAADYINTNGYNCCIIQHEYGIFGGQSGVYIMSLVKRLNIPVVVNLHTILENPSVDEKAILVGLANRASRLIVMNSYAEDLLRKIYKVQHTRIVHLPHGVPDFPKQQADAKLELGFSGNLLIETFGFIGRSKGIETVIKALPKVVASFPEVRYLIIGKTHPNVARDTGEEYRESLRKLVAELHVEAHVIFVNGFLDEEQLKTYLSACDAYVTPYVNKGQITSGTLSFALGAGAAVLSTPYLHAIDLLRDGRGILFPFKDSDVLAEELLQLFTDPAKLANIRAKAKEFGDSLRWSKIGEKYLELYKQVSTTRFTTERIPLKEVKEFWLPSFDLSHIERMTSSFGIFQHAIYNIPNFKEGYCLDDNSRAMMLMMQAKGAFNYKNASKYINIYLSYIHYVQREDGQFRNFVSLSNQYLDEVGSEDAFGRAIWSLGSVFHNPPFSGQYQLAKEIFFRAKPHFRSFTSIRAISYIVLGVVAYLKDHPNDNAMLDELDFLTNFIIHEYQSNSTADWQWFEKVISYDNAVIPYALLSAVPLLKHGEVRDVAFKTLHFLEEIIFSKGYLSIIGNQGWFYYGEEKPSIFGQQPIEVYTVVLLFNEAYKITKEDHYLVKAQQAFQWFTGANELSLSLYDDETKGCCDGLEFHGINRNQGAESTICFWLSFISIYQIMKNIHAQA